MIFKILPKFGMEGNFFNLIKATNENLRVNVTLSCKSFRTFLLRPRTRQGCPISPGVFNSVVEVLIRQLGLLIHLFSKITFSCLQFSTSLALFWLQAPYLGPVVSTPRFTPSQVDSLPAGLQGSPFPKKGNAKECSNYRTIALLSQASNEMLKILQARLQQYVNQELQMFILDLEKAEEPEIRLPTSVGSQKKQENSRKTSTSASLTTL